MHNVPLYSFGVGALQVRSVNSWLDFEEVFIRNFASTYQRPGRPRHLAGCIQKPGERDREYLTRWSNLRNCCEWVTESQAIEFFNNGCRENTLLKHKILRVNPQTMTELMSIADAYAMADSAMVKSIRVNENGQPITDEPDRDRAGPATSTATTATATAAMTMTTGRGAG